MNQRGLHVQGSGFWGASVLTMCIMVEYIRIRMSVCVCIPCRCGVVPVHQGDT